MTTPGDRQFMSGTEGRSDRCSLCKRGPAAVGELIEVPALPGYSPAYICDDCVELCAAMLEHRRMLGGDEVEPDQSVIHPATRKMRDRKIGHVLSTLNRLESEVTKLRYGLSDGYAYSYDEIGEQFGIASERVAEIERRSVEKLRARKPEI